MRLLIALLSWAMIAGARQILLPSSPDMPCETPVHYDSEHRRWTLCSSQGSSEGLSYIFRVNSKGELVQEHFGAPLVLPGPVQPIVNPSRQGWRTELSNIQREYPDLGRGDFRTPAYRVRNDKLNTFTSKLDFERYAIHKGKPRLNGLPSATGKAEEATTLVIHLKDAVSGLKVQLLYTIYHDLPVLVRSASFEADGQDLVLIKAASLSIDFPPSPREVVSLGGDWAAEFKRSRSAVQPGMHSLASRHGASSHQFNPFVALVDPDTDEEHGDAFGFSLVWSGSWLGEIETSTFGLSRLTMGINPELFEWQLKAGATQFDTPECIAVFSRRGLGRMSRTFHDFMKKHISQSPWQDRDRPTLVNSWEAAYFSFNQAKLVQLGSASKPYGVKTLVMDDGWFGSDAYPRNNDTQGLGDWTALSDKLPNGLRGLAKELSTIGIELGVWIEPESVNVKSKLFERFPHWAHQTEGYPLTESRNQLLLDFGRTEVQDWAIETFAEILQHVTFVKLDFNRGIFETKINGAFGHVKGLYRVLGVLAGRFGERVLFENCASGGGRMDPGMLSLFPQTWLSDNTDALARLSIQFGAGLVYPYSSMSGHVSAAPNHQNGRTTPLEFRFHTALMCLSTGFEMDLGKLSEEEASTLKSLTPLIDQVRPLIHHGDVYRLAWPQDSNWPAMLFVSKDQSRAVLFAFQLYSKVIERPLAIKLRGLDATASYRQDNGADFHGTFLVDHGLVLRFDRADYRSRVVSFTRI